MFTFLHKYLIEKKLRNYVQRTFKIIYSDSPDFSSAVKDSIFSGLSGDDEITALVGVRMAAEAKRPLEKSNFKRATIDVINIQKEIKSNNDRNSLEMLRIEWELALLKTQFEVGLRRKSYQRDEWSLDGMMYSMEVANNSPLSREKKESVRNYYDKVKSAQEALDNHLNKSKD